MSYCLPSCTNRTGIWPQLNAKSNALFSHAPHRPVKTRWRPCTNRGLRPDICALTVMCLIQNIRSSGLYMVPSDRSGLLSDQYWTNFCRYFFGYWTTMAAVIALGSIGPAQYESHVCRKNTHVCMQKAHECMWKAHECMQKAHVCMQKAHVFVEKQTHVCM